MGAFEDFEQALRKMAHISISVGTVYSLYPSAAVSISSFVFLRTRLCDYGDAGALADENDFR